VENSTQVGVSNPYSLVEKVITPNSELLTPNSGLEMRYKVKLCNENNENTITKNIMFLLVVVLQLLSNGKQKIVLFIEILEMRGLNFALSSM
jgi:hypothetical protein